MLTPVEDSTPVLNNVPKKPATSKGRKLMKKLMLVAPFFGLQVIRIAALQVVEGTKSLSSINILKYIIIRLLPQGTVDNNLAPGPFSRSKGSRSHLLQITNPLIT